MRNFFVLLIFISPLVVGANSYVGSEQCADCHEEIYNSFLKNSPKSKSFESILKMKKKLTEQEFANCFKCHTTGYEENGFKSENETPYLKNVGCESCHGMGGNHVESENVKDIKRKPSIETCQKCHNEKIGLKTTVMAGAH